MQLTQFTDYSLRVLIYLAEKTTEGLATVPEIADYHGISRNHLVKVIHNLATKGLIITTRGRKGGMVLSRPPSEITLGDVVRATEPNFDIAECFNAKNNCCVIVPTCGLKSIFKEAQRGFIKAMDKYTLADAVTRGKPLKKSIRMTGMNSHAPDHSQQQRPAGDGFLPRTVVRHAAVPTLPFVNRSDSLGTQVTTLDVLRAVTTHLPYPCGSPRDGCIRNQEGESD